MKDIDEFMKDIEEKEEVRKITGRIIDAIEETHPNIEVIGFKLQRLSPEEAYKHAQREADRMGEEMKKKYGIKKFNQWACYPMKPGEELKHPFQKRGKCSKCKGAISYDPKQKKQMTARAKKVCHLCILKEAEKNPKAYPPEQIEYLKRKMN